MILLRTFIILTATICIGVAGPFPPAAGQSGSTAIARTDVTIQAWASRVTSYQPGTGLTAEWSQPERALGPATGQVEHVASLGDGGSITLTFDGVIIDGPGPDFVIFENGFDDYFIECAFVEVSADGVNFVRFPGQSLTPIAVPAFGVIDPTNVDGLGSKYRLGYGEPYDLATAGLSQVTHVRLVDIVGNGSRLDSQNRPIYDPHPVAQSAGFDLEAVAALNFRTWRTLPAGTFSASGTNATAMTHRPDGRLVLGRQGNLLLQDSWGQPQLTALPLNGITLDPSFVAARDLNNLLVGAGGSSSGGSGIHAVAPTSGIVTSPLATLQNFAGCYWKSSLSHREGWIIAGSNASGSHNLTYVSLDGTVSGALTQTLCSYSAGVATDSAGNLYAGLYELLPFPPYSDDTNRVLKWDITEVDAAVASLETSTPVPLTRASSTPLFQFDGAASVTIDAWGRVWATGFASSQLQVYDPTTGSSARFTPDHDPLPGVADVIYQVAAFNDPEGIPSLAFLAQDEIGTAGTPIVYGTAPLTALRVPQDASSWRQHHFGFSLPPAEETTVWGDAADPDQDGLPNLLERVLGRHPLHSDSAQAIEVEVTLGRLRSDFIIDPDAEGAALILEGSNTLAPNDWFTLAELHGSEPFQAASGILVTTRPEGRWTRVTVTDNQFLSSTPQRFVRLRAQPLP